MSYADRPTRRKITSHVTRSGRVADSFPERQADRSRLSTTFEALVAQALTTSQGSYIPKDWMSTSRITYPWADKFRGKVSRVKRVENGGSVEVTSKNKEKATYISGAVRLRSGPLLGGVTG